MSEWILVENRLPNVGEWVLICSPVKNQYLIEIAMFDCFEGFINPSMKIGSFENVSHWQPLPEPPKDET